MKHIGKLYKIREYSISSPKNNRPPSIPLRISRAFLGAAVRSLVITTKALLLEGLGAYPIAKEACHRSSNKKGACTWVCNFLLCALLRELSTVLVIVKNTA
jgi:hypothetical protein